MKKFAKAALATSLAVSLFTGGVYAKDIVNQYKTPRGNVVAVEEMEMHVDRVGLTVNGKQVKKSTLYKNSVTYVPLREVTELLGAEVKYNPTTWSADIKTEDIGALKAQIKKLEAELKKANSNNSNNSNKPSASKLKLVGKTTVYQNENYLNTSIPNLNRYVLDLGGTYPIDIYVSETYQKEFGEGFILDEIEDYFNFLTKEKNFKPYDVEPLDIYLVTNKDQGVKKMVPQMIRESDANDISREAEIFIDGLSMDKDQRFTMVHEISHYYDLLKYKQLRKAFKNSDWIFEGSAEYYSKVVKDYSPNTYNNLTPVWNDRFKTIEKQDFIDEAKFQSGGKTVVMNYEINDYDELAKAVEGNYSVYNANYYYLVEKYGEASIIKMMDLIENGTSRKEAFDKAFGKSEKQLIKEMMEYFNYFK